MRIMKLSVFHLGFSAGLDGPGQRLVIYCKGCNLRCPWCAAPESMSCVPQVLFYSERVTDPADSIAACPYGAVRLDGELISRDAEICAACSLHDCIKTCHPAFELVGQEMSIDALVERAKRYRPFFGQSGGVTIGGGEPTCQFDALRTLLGELKSGGIHTAIETNGTHPELSQLYDLIDLLYIDLKHPSPACYPGDNSGKTLDNIAIRHSRGGEMIVRIPLVSGYNADSATVHLFGKALSSVGPIKIEVLPYHTRGLAKWRACALPFPDQSLSVPTRDDIANTITILQSFGLSV
jgi:glycyl-radical enzyme activating protein